MLLRCESISAALRRLGHGCEAISKRALSAWADCRVRRASDLLTTSRRQIPATTKDPSAVTRATQIVAYDVSTSGLVSRSKHAGATILGWHKLDRAPSVAAPPPPPVPPAPDLLETTESSADPNSVGAVSEAASENPLGLGLILVGATAMAVSAFLPLVEPTSTFSEVADNTPIQHGGWLLVALAVGIATAGYRASRRKRMSQRWAPLVLSVIAAGLVAIDANNKDLRTLYPVGPDGNLINHPARDGRGLWHRLLCCGGGRLRSPRRRSDLLRSAQQRVPAAASDGTGLAATKKCPDCAETGPHRRQGMQALRVPLRP